MIQAPEEELTPPPRAYRWEKVTPVGAMEPTRKAGSRASTRRPRARTCLRKGCGRKYWPKRCNQRYCQDAECSRLVRRWQAARRQAKRRQAAKAKAEHAASQRARRERAKAAVQAPRSPDVRPARGHAAKRFFLRMFATGRVATMLPGRRATVALAIAATPADKPSTKCSTVNASGDLVAR